mgnify:CR=1 FL=1
MQQKPWIVNPNYIVYSDGRIYSKYSDVFLTENTETGYVNVAVQNLDKKSQRVYVHRLVAETFCPNPDNKPFVMHIDKNKENNDCKNLEWSTTEEICKKRGKNSDHSSPDQHGYRIAGAGKQKC